MAEPSRGWKWGSVLPGIPLTQPGDTIVTHPSATLDAQASRLTTARHNANRLHLEMQAEEMRFQATMTAIEAGYKEESQKVEDHYHAQIDHVQQQLSEKMTKLSAQYRSAYTALRREQKAFAEQVKHVDFKGEFIDHFPEPSERPET